MAHRLIASHTSNQDPQPGQVLVEPRREFGGDNRGCRGDTGDAGVPTDGEYRDGPAHTLIWCYVCVFSHIADWNLAPRSGTPSTSRCAWSEVNRPSHRVQPGWGFHYVAVAVVLLMRCTQCRATGRSSQHPLGLNSDRSPATNPERVGKLQWIGFFRIHPIGSGLLGVGVCY